MKQRFLLLWLAALTAIFGAMAQIDNDVIGRLSKKQPAAASSGGNYSSDGSVGGYEYVDLGLPSGTLWAMYNVGASSPEDYGSYFTWGETKTKRSYPDSGAATCGKSLSWLKSNGYIDSKGTLTSSHDAATANWGAAWHMPTSEQLDELIKYTTTEWTTYRGVNGRKVTSTVNGRSIFLPASGYIEDSDYYSRGSYGHVWTANRNEEDETESAYLVFGDDSFKRYAYNDGSGRVVRAVTSGRSSSSKKASDPDGYANGYGYVDLGLPSHTLWATMNVGASSPYQYGSYFAFAEPSTKSSYTDDNCRAMGRSDNWLRNNHYLDDKGNLNADHDAATANWGSSWRLPTAKEVDELVNNTTYEWVTINGITGCLVKSKINGKTIFLPAAGHMDNSSGDSVGEYGHYWDSTPDSEKGSYLLLGSDRFYRYCYQDGAGRSVRAVRK